ncbi:hypothetical protein [Schaalia sp. Marseille-Q2122]|uniref:hypothetical protein n=1 Tax=Schaalia sp. Marseille-Q2122 TaxID=2736604 RepID=UPI00158C6270|nr:hypothetical protein [Schaalia sp. Marseille-Q2122]
MSASSAARTRPASRPDFLHEVSTPQLRVVEGVSQRRRLLPIVVVIVLVLVTAIVVPMVLNTRMAQTSFAIREQQLELNRLEAEAWTARTKLREVSSPGNLEKAAKNMGMVPAAKTGIITLSSGTIEGGNSAR